MFVHILFYVAVLYKFRSYHVSLCFWYGVSYVTSIQQFCSQSHADMVCTGLGQRFHKEAGTRTGMGNDKFPKTLIRVWQLKNKICFLRKISLFFQLLTEFDDLVASLQIRDTSDGFSGLILPVNREYVFQVIF